MHLAEVVWAVRGLEGLVQAAKEGVGEGKEGKGGGEVVGMEGARRLDRRKGKDVDSPLKRRRLKTNI